jgi:hypothetical protein
MWYFKTSSSVVPKQEEYKYKSRVILGIKRMALLDGSFRSLNGLSPELMNTASTASIVWTSGLPINNPAFPLSEIPIKIPT